MVEYAKCCKVTLVIVLNPIYGMKTFISNFTEEIENMHVRKGWYEIQCLNHPLICVKVHQHVLLFTFLFVCSKTKSFLSLKIFSVNQDVLYLFHLHRTILIGWYVIRIWHHFDGTRAWWPRQTVVDLQIWKYNIRRLVYKTVCILMVQKGPSMENGSLSKHYRGTEVISDN